MRPQLTPLPRVHSDVSPETIAAGAVTLTGTNANQFTIATNGCSNVSLAPAATCTISVRFRATSTGTGN